MIDCATCVTVVTVVENEKHFLFDCPLYSDLRYNLYYECSKNIDNCYTLDNDDKFINMMHCKEMWNRIFWHWCYITKRFKRVLISPYHWRFIHIDFATTRDISFIIHCEVTPFTRIQYGGVFTNCRRVRGIIWMIFSLVFKGYMSVHILYFNIISPIFNH
jgi:hypothetical protein